MSVTDRFYAFFDEIGIKLNENEINALNARHYEAHGGGFNQSPELMIRNRDSYETILNKTILKLLNYSGDYIDYSNVGWKDCQL